MSTEVTSSGRPHVHVEPNHRQQLALERIEYAVGELATVLLANCRSREVARGAIAAVRKAMAPALAEIVAAD